MFDVFGILALIFIFCAVLAGVALGVTLAALNRQTHQAEAWKEYANMLRRIINSGNLHPDIHEICNKIEAGIGLK